MKVNLDIDDRLFLERINRLKTGSVQEIADDMGVTATAVRQRLVRLLGVGLIKRELERGGRGRPHHRYRLTDQALRQLGENYGELAMILWREMRNFPDPQVRKILGNRVKESLVRRLGGNRSSELPNLPDRLARLEEEMLERGYNVEIDRSRELPVLREKSCPYMDLAGEDRSICELEQQVFSEILGVPARLTQCCQDEHHCCEFVISAEPVDSGRGI